MFRSLISRLAAVIIPLLLYAPGTTHASPTPRWLDCPDSSQTDPLRLRDRGMVPLSEPSPSAGGATSADLAHHAHLAAKAYEMHEAFELGEDPIQELPTNLRSVALIFGDPGPDERRWQRRVRFTRTFYGYIADDTASGRRVVVFRGTLQPNEWLRNLQARMRPFDTSINPRGLDARVHAGAHRSARPERPQPYQSRVGIGPTVLARRTGVRGGVKRGRRHTAD